MESELLSPIEEEFEGAELGDVRLNARLLMMAEALDEAPTASLASSSKTVAAREAAYRFVENGRVTMDALLAPHRRETAKRCAEAKTVYVVSDTSEFTFSGAERGKTLGRVQGKRRGFLGHVALAVSADGVRKPLGILGIDVIVRDEEKKDHGNTHQQKRDPNRESLRWGAMVEHAEKQLEGVKAIHIMDREADIFELLAELTAGGRGFVIRAAQDRWVEGEGRLFEAVTEAEVLLERQAQLSARPKVRWTSKGRGHPQRQARMARLTISSREVTLRRPKTTNGQEYPAALKLNVVNVWEPSPPTGEPPIQWVLLTSEPVETVKQVEAVVDAYRARWLIEEYFKALKTGCAYEDRQLRSIPTLTNALAIFAVIAWRLLLLRTLEREASETPASTVLRPILIEALAARLKHIREPRLLPANPSVADVMRGIARLGGHHKSNGPPGWQLLWRGFQDLLTWSSGFIAGRSSTSCDHS